jgi:serine protease Do
MRVGVGIAIFAVAAAALPRGTSGEPTYKELLAAFEQQLKAVSDSVGPSVVCVVVSRSDAYPTGGPARPGRLGGFDPKEFVKSDPSPARAELARRLDLSDPRSAADHGFAGGVVTDAEGLVLVNYHTIEDATKVYVHLGGGKGSYADIHAADRRSDLAVLKLLTPPPGLKPIRFGDVRLVERSEGRAPTMFPGKLVVLLTHSTVGGFAVDRPSLASSHIKNVRVHHTLAAPAAPPPNSRENQSEFTVYNYGTFLEYDARKAYAGSGGAVVNLDGELVGLTTALAAPTGPETGLGFALPMDANTRRIVDVLRRGEEVEYGFLGVEYSSGSSGVRIDLATPQGPAQLAGLRPGEEITQVDDVPVRDRRDLFYTVSNALAGTRVRVRTGLPPRGREVEVTLGKLQHASPYLASVRPEPVFGLRVEYGSILINTNPMVRPFGVPPGVIVRELVPNSQAAAKFKELGDLSGRVVITAVNGTEVTNPAEFYRAAKGRKSVRLTLVDPLDPGGRTRELTLP